MNSNKEISSVNEHSNRSISLPYDAEGLDDVFEAETPTQLRQSYFRVDVPSAIQSPKNGSIWESGQSFFSKLFQLFS